MAFVIVCAGLAYAFVQGAKVVAELMDRTFLFLVDSKDKAQNIPSAFIALLVFL